MSRVPEEELNIKLPSGFHLEEEGDFLFLFFQDEKIANFTATGVNPKEVEKEAKEYLESLEMKAQKKKGTEEKED